MPFERKHRVDLCWQPHLAYGIGLIASDGCLKDGRKVWFSSKEMEMIRLFQNSFQVFSKVGRYARGGEVNKKYFYTTICDKSFYEFLVSIGITPAKSKTIKKVTVPKQFFGDFLRGLFDGDGTFYTFTDKRWPKSFGYRLTIASASKKFLVWLKDSLADLYGVSGFIKVGDGVYELRYVKRDAQKLFMVMYSDRKTLFLKRKYNKIKAAFEFDQKLHPERVQASAGVAQW